jgi:hypothetical protein
VDLSHQTGLGLSAQDDPAVHPGRQTSSVDLGDPPNRQQRVRPGPQYQLLQVPDPFSVSHLRRREDPLPQTPYVLLLGTPIYGVPVEQFVLRSVHHRDQGHGGA